MTHLTLDVIDRPTHQQANQQAGKGRRHGHIGKGLIFPSESTRKSRVYGEKLITEGEASLRLEVDLREGAESFQRTV